MPFYTKFDEKIHEMFEKKSQEVQPSQAMFSVIQQKICQEEERRKENSMKTFFGKKGKSILVACCVLAATTATCFASGKIMSYTSSSHEKITEFPSQSVVEEFVGFTPNYVKQFENGFVFQEYSVTNNSALDAEGNTISQDKGLAFTYGKQGETGEVCFYAEPVLQEAKVEEDVTETEDSDEISLENDVTGMYYDYQNKCVPPDYEMTEQDRLDEANGTYVFSYGTDEIMIDHVQYLEWKQNDIAYSVACSDDSVNKEDLIEMAKEVLKEA